MPDNYFEREPTRVLYTYEIKDRGRGFRIEAGDRGRDVFATIRYLTPPERSYDDRLRAVLKFGVDRMGILKHRKILLDSQPSDASDQYRINREIVFGDSPTYTDLQRALSDVFGVEDAAATEITILESLIDEGYFDGYEIIGSPTEIETASPERIAAEMAMLTNEYYGLDD